MHRLAWIGGIMLALGCGQIGADADADATPPAPDAFVADADPLGCARRLGPEDGATAVQTALIEAPTGGLLCFLPGRYTFTDELSLTVDGVTMLGLDDGVIFDFAGQVAGGNGLSVTGNDFTLERIEIHDPPGDGVRITGTTGLTIRNARVIWTGGPAAQNGAYGFYPIGVDGVLIEDSEVSGASDAGFYVGQSRNIIVRRNQAHGNVAGIEIENSTHAEVYENHAYDNTGGMLVFALPDLPKKDCTEVSVHDNLIEANNRVNFGDASSIVAIIPPGTGMLVLAADRTEFFANEIRDHTGPGITIISYLTIPVELTDEEYDPWIETMWIHGNTFVNNGESPQGFFQILGLATLEDILYDGMVDPAKNNSDGALSVCVSDLGTATFRMFDEAGNYVNSTTDPTPWLCTHDPIPPVEL
jgi:parallel beta-helix repeat protein